MSEKQKDDGKGAKAWTSLVVSGSLALTGCSSPGSGRISQGKVDTSLDTKTGSEVVGGDQGTNPEVGPGDTNVPDYLVNPPDGSFPDGNFTDGWTRPACDWQAATNPLSLEPEKMEASSDEPLIFWATVDVDLGDSEHELEVELDDYSLLQSVVKVEEGKWKIEVKPSYSFFSWGANVLTVTLRVACAEGTREYTRERYFCEGNIGEAIVVDEKDSQDCMMVCDPMPPPPEAECPEAFKGGVTMTPDSDSLWGDQLLKVTAKLDEQYDPSWYEPHFFTDIGKITKLVRLSSHEYEIYWSRFTEECTTDGGKMGKLSVEWPALCLDEGAWPPAGYIYAELNLCVGFMGEAHVIDAGEQCPMVADPLPAPACPPSALKVTPDKASFNIAQSLHVDVEIDPTFVDAQASVSVEASSGTIYNLARDCESGLLDFSWKTSPTLQSEAESSTVTLKIDVYCAETGGNEGAKSYTEELEMCIQPDGTIVVSPQTCSLFPLSTPVRTRIRPLVKRGLSLSLRSEHDLGAEDDVRYRWTVTDGRLASIDTKQTVWILPPKSGAYLIQSFATKGDEGVGTDMLTVNVYEGAVRSIVRG